MSDFEKFDEEEFDYEDVDWDEALGINKLSLNYPAHAEGIEGECFNYSVYFEGGAGESQAEAVGKAIDDHDFKLAGDDDYIGYISVSVSDGTVGIYLDLGNTEPQNENRIIHGILLALNNVQGIKKVIVNEGCGEY